MSSATHSASREMPALPGAHHSFVSSGEAAIFQASACSRPPEPSRRTFMAVGKRKRADDTREPGVLRTEAVNSRLSVGANLQCRPLTFLVGARDNAIPWNT